MYVGWQEAKAEGRGQARPMRRIQAGDKRGGKGRVGQAKLSLFRTHWMGLIVWCETVSILLGHTWEASMPDSGRSQAWKPLIHDLKEQRQSHTKELIHQPKWFKHFWVQFPESCATKILFIKNMSPDGIIFHK
jgi:hypothetical protein